MMTLFFLFISSFQKSQWSKTKCPLEYRYFEENPKSISLSD